MRQDGELTQLRKLLRTVLSWVAILLGALCINLFLFTTVGIRGNSMEPSLLNGDRALVPLWQNWWPGAGFARGDIVFFPDPAAQDCHVRCPWVIKRIIGLPGEVVAISQGVVSIDGQELPEPYLGETWKGSFSMEQLTVPQDSYFVLGDNRYPYGSFDSRTYGPVPADSIGGRASAVLWPPIRLGDGGARLNLHGL